MITFGKKLMLLRKMKGMTQEELAKKVHVSGKALSFWENDHTEPGMETTRKLAAIFKVSLDELLGAADATETMPQRPRESTDAPDMHTLPVLSKVPANVAIAFAAAKETAMADVKYSRKDHYCLTVTGRSMHPTIYEGDTVVVQVHEMALSEYDETEGPVQPLPWKQLHKRVVIASVNGEEPTVKRLFCFPRKDTGFKIMLQPDNRSADTIEIDRDHTLVIRGIVKLIMRDPMNFE